MFGTPLQQEILTRLNGISPVYIVGGAVRDQQLGFPSRDIDVVIALSGDVLEKQLKDWGYVPHRLGQKQPTVTFFDGPDRLDMVELSGDLFQDAMRRDFTLNALYSRVGTGELVDPVSGLLDLQAGIVRACGNPEERFQEDPLRILRLVRIAVQYGFRIEELTWAAAVNALPRLVNVARERITEELSKILVLQEVEAGILMLADIGYWQADLPELSRLKGLVQNRYHTKDAWEHTLHVVKNTPPSLLLRLAALWHDLGKWDTASRECRLRGKIVTNEGGLAIGDFRLEGKNLDRWRGEFAEVKGGRLDNHPDTVIVKQVTPSRLGRPGFEWVPDGKRHFLNHERESARLVRDILPRFTWPMFLQATGGKGEQELIFLIENHMAGTLAFMAELRGEGNPAAVKDKAKHFAWVYGWNGRDFNPARVKNLLQLWRADFLGGKLRAEGDQERFETIFQEIVVSVENLAERWQGLDWSPVINFAKGKALPGEEFGRFKDYVRQEVMLHEDPEWESTVWLEQEFRRFRKRRGTKKKAQIRP
ncbi:MAG: tRNA nucleotidyltransferase/poly(A) polymerase family protein [Desulfitobacteriaceae bacterium]